MLTSRLDVYISRYGDFCAHDDNDNDTTDYFTPCACTRGNNSCSLLKAIELILCHTVVHVLSLRQQVLKHSIWPTWALNQDINSIHLYGCCYSLYSLHNDDRSTCSSNIRDYYNNPRRMHEGYGNRSMQAKA